MTQATSSSSKLENAIEVVDLHKHFGKFHVHRGLNLKIKRGSITYIMGGSGVGKSVLLKQLMGFLAPTSGDILIHGESIVKASPDRVKTIRRGMGILFQNGALFDSMSVYDNVAFALREQLKLPKSELDARVEAHLKSVGLAFEHAMKMPSDLSGGQRKRVALARAIALQPSIMMYDEPTTGLDPITTEMVTNLIRDTNRDHDLTTLVISHDIHVAFDVAEEIAFLKDGVVKFFGPPDQVWNVTDPDVRVFFKSEQKRLGVS
jgi:phospholipid/cholesterol/gamma-HCH transport system ATP-binding protein